MATSSTMNAATRQYMMSKLYEGGKPLCFCLCPAGEYKTKKGDVYLKCGDTVDYKAVTDILKDCKSSDEKLVVYENARLGCKMNMLKQQFSKLHPNLFGDEFKHPLCKGHNLICKLGMASNEKNKGRMFFACDASYPDSPCDHFAWLEDHEGFEDLKNEGTGSSTGNEAILKAIEKKGTLLKKRKLADMS